MKKGLLLLPVLILLSSCNITLIEEAPYDPRNNFLGRFEAEEYSETYDLLSFYNMRVVKDGDPFNNVIYLRNFYAVDIEVFAEVIGNRVNIPRQRIGDFIVQGTGRNEFGDIYLTYSVEDLFSNDGVTDFCNAILRRR